MKPLEWHPIEQLLQVPEAVPLEFIERKHNTTNGIQNESRAS
jgi:hypothetical protein